MALLALALPDRVVTFDDTIALRCDRGLAYSSRVYATYMNKGEQWIRSKCCRVLASSKLGSALVVFPGLVVAIMGLNGSP